MEPHENTTALLSNLLNRAQAGDRTAWEEVLAHFRPRLRRMVALRLDRRLQGRVDASDVIQEAYLEADTRLATYLAAPDMPFFLWLRFLVSQKLLILHRRHFGAHKRDAAREQPLDPSAGLADHLLDQATRPSEAAVREEARTFLLEAIGNMDPLDREVLTLRHFEQLSNQEVAQLLNIKTSTASRRYLRALDRLREILAEHPDVFG